MQKFTMNRSIWNSGVVVTHLHGSRRRSRRWGKFCECTLVAVPWSEGMHMDSLQIVGWKRRKNQALLLGIQIVGGR